MSDTTDVDSSCGRLLHTITCYKTLEPLSDHAY
jgi:hypothetical protein